MVVERMERVQVRQEGIGMRESSGEMRQLAVGRHRWQATRVRAPAFMFYL